MGRTSAHVSKRSQHKTEGRPWKLLLWTAIAGLIFGLIGAGEIVEGPLRTIRNSFHWHNASGDIVLVKIDRMEMKSMGPPAANWPRLSDRSPTRCRVAPSR